MKKYLYYIIIILGLVLANHASAEYIDSFAVDIDIQKDSTIKVVESIDYNFEGSQRHGIFRTIPYSYKARGGSYALRISIQSVTDQDGVSYPFVVSQQSGQLSIKIGDPQTYVSGQKTYIIAYDVDRAINYFDDHDELFWNITGNDWHVPIRSASAHITIPNEQEAMIQDVACFTGAFGSQETDCEGVINDSEVSILSTAELGNSRGLTGVISIPLGILEKPSLAQRIAWFLEDNGILFLPVLVLGLMSYLWFTFGRDKGEKRTVIAEYEPPEQLTPSEVGAIIDETVQNRDISAIILNLAVQGYIKIRRIEEKKLLGSSVDYEFTKQKDVYTTLPEFEREFMQGLFANDSNSTKLSDLKNKFYTHIPKIRKSIYRSIVTKQYFHKSPVVVRNKYMVIAGLIAFTGFFFAPLGAVYPIAIVISGIIVFIFSFHMPAATRKGRIIKEKIRGYKLFLSVTETDRASFHFDPKKHPELFERYLPYAIVFGVEKKWAEQFKDIVIERPQWYEGNETAFNPIVFSGMMHDLHSSVMNTTTSTPSSGASGGSSGFGGGGFSGGGFGGGGGGSW